MGSLYFSPGCRRFEEPAATSRTRPGRAPSRRQAGSASGPAACATFGCDDGKAKVESGVKKAEQVVDKLDRDEAAGHLAAAKAALAQGTDPAVPCTWVTSHPEATELARLCSFDVPLRRATVAVTKAEKARAEVPDAPTLTECMSDEWTKAKQKLDGAYASEPAWTALAARWTKVCPGS